MAVFYAAEAISVGFRPVQATMSLPERRSDHYSPVSFHSKVEFTLLDELIDSSRHTTLTRAENLALFRELLHIFSLAELVGPGVQVGVSPKSRNIVVT